MTSIGAIFTSTCHTIQLNPCPNSSASCVVIHSWLSAYQGKIGPFEGHLSTHGHQTGLRKRPEWKQLHAITIKDDSESGTNTVIPSPGPKVIFCMIMLMCLRIYFNRAFLYIWCSNRAVLYRITSFGAYNMDTWHA